MRLINNRNIVLRAEDERTYDFFTCKICGMQWDYDNGGEVNRHLIQTHGMIFGTIYWTSEPRAGSIYWTFKTRVIR